MDQTDNRYLSPAYLCCNVTRESFDPSRFTPAPFEVSSRVVVCGASLKAKFSRRHKTEIEPSERSSIDVIEVVYPTPLAAALCVADDLSEVA